MKINHLLLLCVLLVYTSSTYSQAKQAPKTPFFKEYEKANAFKGIKFGSSLCEINSKLRISEGDYLFNMFSITNPAYLNFSGLRFDHGQAYFTEDCEFYQAVLTVDSLVDGLSAYQELRKDFLELFGKNDSERADLPTRMIDWNGEVMHFSLMFDPITDKSTTGAISIMIYNTELNTKKTKERLKRNTSSGSAKIPEM